MWLHCGASRSPGLGLSLLLFTGWRGVVKDMGGRGGTGGFGGQELGGGRREVHEMRGSISNTVSSVQWELWPLRLIGAGVRSRFQVSLWWCKRCLGSSWETLVFGQRESRLSLIVNNWTRWEKCTGHGWFHWLHNRGPVLVGFLDAFVQPCAHVGFVNDRLAPDSAAFVFVGADPKLIWGVGLQVVNHSVAGGAGLVDPLPVPLPVADGVVSVFQTVVHDVACFVGRLQEGSPGQQHRGWGDGANNQVGGFSRLTFPVHCFLRRCSGLAGQQQDTWVQRLSQSRRALHSQAAG